MFSDEKIFKPMDVCKTLRISRRTLRRLVHSGALGAFRIGGAIRIAQSDLDTFLAASRIDPRPVSLSRKTRR